MKNKLTTVKFIAVALATCLFSACTITTLTSNEPWQGKVWRGKVQVQFVDTSKIEKQSEELTKKTKYDVDQLRNLRMAKVTFMDGQMFRLSVVMVPDSLEFSDIERGAVVDFIVEPGVVTDFSIYKTNRILRLVCKAKDEDCIDREKAAKRLNSIIDPAPGDTFKKYGETFKRRNTPADIVKYN